MGGRLGGRTVGAPSSDAELVFGLVGALGAGLDQLGDKLADALADIGYVAERIRVSQLLHEIPRWADIEAEDLEMHIKGHQEAGNMLRELTGFGGAMAALAIGHIQAIRSAEGGDPAMPLPRRAYVIRSLKHPAEVELLRRVYGSSFFLLAAYSPVDTRVTELAVQIAKSHRSADAAAYRSKAQQLIEVDEAEAGRELGQQVRDTFPLADVFFSSHKPNRLLREVERFVELLFGHPFHTPSIDEYAMFHARAVSLRSADPSRQVGAVIATDRGELVSMGTNDVPSPRGGLYWPGDDGDARDFQSGKSTSHELREMALGEILMRLDEAEMLQTSERESLDALTKRVAPLMRGTLLMGTGEFGRAVHAEMAALMDAARRGVAVGGSTLFSTTFPCHNCTKHIIAAELKRVVYIEPFPKSQALRLHSDAIVVDSGSVVPGRVNFEPFVGIAPRRYGDLFDAPKRKQSDDRLTRWKWKGAVPRFARTGDAYVTRLAEHKVMLSFRGRLSKAGLAE